MSVSVAQVRSQIRDLPRPCVRPGQWELIAAPADGDTVKFPIRYANAILASLAVAFQADPTGSSTPPPFTPVLASDPTSGYTAAVDAYGQPSITFTNAPDQGTIIGVRYLATGFTDAELTNYLALSTRATDEITLIAVHAKLIPVILSDRDLLMLFKLNDRVDDPTEWQRTQLALLKSLKQDLMDAADEDPEGGRGGGYFGGGYGGFGGGLIGW